MLTQVKPTTRVYLLVTLFCTVVHLAGLPAPVLFSLDASKWYEIWRPVTSVAYLGAPSMSMANSLYFLLRYGQTLEETNGERLKRSRSCLSSLTFRTHISFHRSRPPCVVPHCTNAAFDRIGAAAGLPFPGASNDRGDCLCLQQNITNGENVRCNSHIIDPRFPFLTR